MKNPTLTQARRELARWYKEVERLQDELCANRGHIKGPGAFEGYSYCKGCGSQIANSDFRGKTIPLPVIDPDLLDTSKEAGK